MASKRDFETFLAPFWVNFGSFWRPLFDILATFWAPFFKVSFLIYYCATELQRPGLGDPLGWDYREGKPLPEGLQGEGWRQEGLRERAEGKKL